MKLLDRRSPPAALRASTSPASGEVRISFAREWWLPLTVGLVLAVVTLIPYLYAYAVQPQGRVFVGFFYLWDDATTYVAKMREGWEGLWPWQNRYTTESSPPAYLFMFWIVLGHVAGITHLPLVAVFHLARFVGAIALMAGGRLFITHFRGH